MAGSPAYMQHITDIATQHPDEHTIEAAWANLTNGGKEHLPYTLWQLAITTFNDIAETTNTPLGVVLADALALHVAKNAGYAGHSADPWANFRLAEAFGVSAVDGVLVRMSDKYSRYTSLTQNAANDRVGESIIDTKKDLAAYALIALCIIEED